LIAGLNRLVFGSIARKIGRAMPSDRTFPALQNKNSAKEHLDDRPNAVQ